MFSPKLKIHERFSFTHVLITFFAKSNLMGKQQTVPFKLLQLLQDNSLPHSMGG